MGVLKAEPRTAWLPPDKRAAVVFTVDDVHPGRSTDAYEAGGDLADGALGHIEWLLERHPALEVTLFVTADWREISPFPTRKLLSKVPVLRDRVYLAPVHPKGTMRLDRHPRFIEYLKSLPRTEIAFHGLHHIHTGLRLPVEFQEQSAERCASMLRQATAIFEDAGLPYVRGITPPGWNLPEGLARALVELEFAYVASARDVKTPIASGATNGMSGLKGVSILHPELIRGTSLVHIPTNFQANNAQDRAFSVLDNGGLLSIKAHIVKRVFNYTAIDGMDELYRNYLDSLLCQLEDRYAESLWWTSMGKVASYMANHD